MRDWLRSQGLRDGDITIVVGSGQSRAERGKPRALVELLRTAWRGPSSQTLLDSLPIAGVDGTLVNRMKSGAATGQAYLKTGTLSDTRALAGYVRAKSGKVYAVSLVVTDAEAGARHAGARRRRRVDRERRLGLGGTTRARCRARGAGYACAASFSISFSIRSSRSLSFSVVSFSRKRSTISGSANGLGTASST